MKKRLFILMLVLIMALCVFVACGDDEETPDDTIGGDENCEHEWKSESKVDSTCAAEGSETFKCSKCGAAKTDAIPKGNAHKYKVTEEIKATCKEFSKTVKVCELCEDKQEEIGTKKESHKNAEMEVLKPTCTADGQRAYACTVCGEPGYKVGMETVIPKLGHSYEVEGKEFAADAGVTFVAATCDKDGYFNRVCVNCNYDQDPITREEYKTYEGTANFDSTKYYDMEAWGHDFSEFLREVPATCTTNGYEEFKCSRCSETTKEARSEAFNHLYYKDQNAVEGTHYVIVQYPTCIAEGKKAYICINENCGELATSGDGIESIAVIPHDTTNRDAAYLEKDVLATCTTDAYKVYKCCVDKLCVETEKVVDEGTALGHLEVVNGAQTCKTNGMTPYKCGRDGCTEEWLDEPTNPNIRHSPMADKVSEATCITNAVYKCSVCGSTFGPYIDDDAYADGIAHGVHVFQYSETVAPTCSSVGYKVYTCVGDGACTATRKDDTNTDMTQPDVPKAEDVVDRISHTFDTAVTPDGRIVCSVCFTEYRDVTTEITNGGGSLCLGCGNTPCDCGLTVEWNGYVSPVVPDAHILGANSERVISSIEWKEVADKGEKPLAIGGGVIVFDGEASTTYTVKIYDKANGTLLETVTVTGNSIIDLYKYEEVGQVAITASTVARVFFYAII